MRRTRLQLLPETPLGLLVVVLVLQILCPLGGVQALHRQFTRTELVQTFGVQKVEHVPEYDLIEVKRDRLPDSTVHTISFKAWNSTYVVQLEPNHKIISPHMTSVVRDGNSSTSFRGFPANINTNCHFHGRVISHNNQKAAISDCTKLMGVIVHDDHYLMLQTIPHRFHEKDIETPKHLVYKREAALINPLEHFAEEKQVNTSPSLHPSVLLSGKSEQEEEEEFCDIKSVFALNYTLPSEAKLDSLFIFPQLDPITLEIGLFLDSQLYEHFKREFSVDPEQHLTDFSLALINNVHVLYQQPTLSPNLDIVIVHFEMWKTQPSPLATELHKNGQAQTLLDSFCRHQARINPGSDLTDPGHWDHGVLLTGYDIYHTTASVAGVAPVGRMCDELFACSLVEGLHLGRSFVLAHEMGHNMGMVHDGVQNQCGRSCCLMSAVNGAGKTTWSNCSVREFNSFLLQLDESGRGNCLRDPAESIASHDHLKDGRLPGQRFTADQQCSYFWGRDYQVEIPNGRIFEDICRILWCGNNGSTISTAHPALEGSWCGGTKWCHEGKCEQWNNLLSPAPTVVHGEWSEWSSVEKVQCPITPCQITGSIPLKSQLRTCTNPAPNNGGANCFGSNVRGLLCGQAKSTCEGFTRQEFGDRLCTAIRNDPSRPDRQLSGQSFPHTSQPCKIWCHVRDSELIRNKGQFPNGSPCGVEQYCVSGTCLSLSCSKQAIVAQPSDCPPVPSTNVRQKQSKWDSWAAWSQCSTTCGDHGVQKRLRKCRSPDSECAGKSSEVRPCEPSPPRCQPFSEWTNWTNCSETCGPPTKRKRTRSCLNGSCAPELLEEQEDCQQAKCPEWEAWQEWSVCSAHCGQGERQRTRKCPEPGACQGDSQQLASCFEKPCQDDGWSEWMPCSVSCGIGFQLRERHCNGQLCPENNKQARTCNVQDCSKIKTGAVMSQWSLWSACSKTCGQGFQHRHRKCLNGICAVKEVLSEQKRCVLGPCPAWQAWQPWSPCSSCSVFETRRRARKCMVQVVGVGGVEEDTEVDHTSCSGVPIEYDTCERSCLEPENESVSSPIAHGIETLSGLGTPIVPVDSSNGQLLPKGSWLAWQEWLPCSAACGQGLRQRIRACPDGKDCSTTGLSFEIEACNKQPCSTTASFSKAANSWSDWQEWSSCSKSCGGGRQMRTRKCLASLIFLCDGYAKEERPCSTQPCASALRNTHQSELQNVIPEWSGWSDWSKCSCFTLNKFRRRYCKIIEPAIQGFCSGAIIQQQACQPSTCVSESGGWSEWSEWSRCSRECGINGHQIRNRMCSNPLPSNRGSYCVGYSFDQRPCQPQLTCKDRVVDGQWSKWTSWSVCSDPCVNGQRSRTRYCSEPRPENGGLQCIGSDFELQACSEPSKCSSLSASVHGQWSQWSEWSNCSSPCGFSFQSRSRMCSSPAPSNGGKVCSGLAYMTSVCSSLPDCPDSTIDGQWAEWSEWTYCSTVNCDGTRTRVRECNRPPPSTAGLPCFGRSSQMSKCPDRRMGINLLDARFCQSNWVANTRLVETGLSKLPL